MSAKILFIGENFQSFLIKALIKSLNEANYEVIFATPDVNYIDIIKAEGDFPEIIILYLERIGDEGNHFFSYIKNLLESDEGKKNRLYFIGSMVEINQAYEVIDKNYVKYAFERPVEVTDLLKMLERDGGDYALSNETKQYKLEEGKKTILLIDDEIMQLRAMSRWLEKTYNVLTEKSGTEGISLLKQYKVDLILLDYEMPVLSGVEVLRLLKSDPATAEIPVVFLTGTDDSSVVKQVVELRPAGYLLKGSSPVILAQKIDAIFKNLEGVKEPPKTKTYYIHKK